MEAIFSPLRPLSMMAFQATAEGGDRSAVVIDKGLSGETRSRHAKRWITLDLFGYRSARRMAQSSMSRTRRRSAPANLSASWPGLSRLSRGECGAFVRTPSRCKKLSKLASSARRGCPRQARARRAGVVCDLRFTTGLAEPDSRGTSTAMTAAPSRASINVRLIPTLRAKLFDESARR
jgi:hypothetical protein